MRFLDAFLSRLATVSAVLAGAVMLIMMLQVSLDVMLKHFFSMPIPTTLEMVSSYYMVALVFLPLGVVTRDHEHLEVELFTQGVSVRTLSWFKAFGCIVGIFYAGVMTYKGFSEALYKTQIREIWETATFNMEVWPSRWFYPFGTLLTACYLALHLANHLSIACTGRALIERHGDHLPENGLSAGDDGAIGVGLDARHGGRAAD